MHKNFRTVLPPLSYPFRLKHTDGVVCMGSCFAEHMAARLKNYQFEVCQNPFGILYNPISLFEGIDYLLNNQAFSAEDLFEDQEKWHSFAHHSQFSHPQQDKMLEVVNAHLQQGAGAIREAKLLILTFGTAFIFSHIAQQRIVGNCHKLPASQFEKSMLLPEAIIESGSVILNRLQAVNPDLQVLFSVSPVRHIKNGLVENQRSKASLQLAIARFCEKYDFVHYFPAYELLLDDLRDYRFYGEDLIHPNKMAVDYIWDYFAESLFAPSTLSINKILDKISAACRHRPFHPQTSAHQHFLCQQLEQIDKTAAKYPFLTFEKERKILSEQLI